MKLSFSCRNLLLASFLFACAPLFAQDKPEIHHRDKPADAAELAAITERGRAIATYDKVAWHATDAVIDLPGAKDLVGMYIGRKTDAGWVVAFGKLNANKDAFLLAFEAQPTGDVLHPRVVTHTPPLEERGEWLNIARAYDLARQRLTVNVPYNGTVLAAPDNDWYVYFYPAQTKDGVFPTGADTRFRISHDGLTIKEVHKMHLSLLENDLSGKDGRKMVMSYHTAVIDDVTEDTDVANVLIEGGMPMMIAGRNFVYKISADGTIAFMMKTKDLQKTNK